MLCYFYNTKSSERTMNKDVGGDFIISEDVTIKDTMDSEELHLLVKYREDLMSANEVMINKNGIRKYHIIRNKNIVTGGMIEFVCHSDVLMNARDYLMAKDAAIKKITKGSGSYIVDSEISLDSRPNYEIIQFPQSPFSQNMDYVLCISGSAEVENE